MSQHYKTCITCGRTLTMKYFPFGDYAHRTKKDECRACNQRRNQQRYLEAKAKGISLKKPPPEKPPEKEESKEALQTRWEIAMLEFCLEHDITLYEDDYDKLLEFGCAYMQKVFEKKAEATKEKTPVDAEPLEEPEIDDDLSDHREPRFPRVDAPLKVDGPCALPIA